MPWTAQSFRSRHNRKLSDVQAEHASRMANAMLKQGVDEGIAIATANKRVGRLAQMQKRYRQWNP